MRKTLFFLFIIFTINSLAKEPTFREMAANLIIIGFKGISINQNPQIVKDIENGLGGVILFDKDPTSKGYKNIVKPIQLKAFTTSLQKIANNRLIIAIDQEGGKVQRLKNSNGFLSTPSAKKIGTMGLKKAKYYYQRMGKMLKENHINVNFAPVVDLAIEPRNGVIYKLQRSFSNDSIKVTNYARVFIKAMRQNGVVSVLKHFPGHGSSLKDSHKGFVDVTDTWIPNELDPYYILIQENQVDLIMTAHVFNENIDNLYPATLSYKTNTILLREILGYQGAIISDDLQMGAISRNYSLEDAIMYSLNSGVDLLLFANQTKKTISLNKILDIMETLLKKKKITKARVRDAYRRVQKLKDKIQKYSKF